GSDLEGCRGGLGIGHPVMEPTRHDDYFFKNARNRVWLARRCLHWPFSWAYVGSWTLVQLVRTRDRAAMRTWWRGWLNGWTSRPWPEGGRPKKLRWRTLARMTRHGRLPVL
ncbi:MAG TPA: hypothetical protein PKE42_09870, partial [Arachnia sp.]|nr:hypothetical protein [Arachnia sp.]